jgi:hypothetical protein
MEQANESREVCYGAGNVNTITESNNQSGNPTPVFSGRERWIGGDSEAGKKLFPNLVGAGVGNSSGRTVNTAKRIN